MKNKNIRVYQMPRYYIHEGKRYYSKEDMGKLSKAEKRELIRGGALVLAKETHSRPLGTAKTGHRRRKCEKWGEAGNRALWADAMAKANGNPKIASTNYRTTIVPVTGVAETRKFWMPPTNVRVTNPRAQSTREKYVMVPASLMAGMPPKKKKRTKSLNP